VDAEVSRPIREGSAIIKDMQNSSTLREYVVIALGTNGTDSYERQYTQIIDAINPGHRVIIVTPYDGRSNNNARAVNATAEWLRGLSDTYDFVTIADWHSIISTQTNLLAGDRVHMGGNASRQLYTDVVADAIAIAAEKPAK